LVAQRGVGRVVDRLAAGLVVDRGRRRARGLVDGELFAGAGLGGVVGVAAVAGLVAVGARAQGGAGGRVGHGLAGGDGHALGAAATGRAVVAGEQDVADGGAAVE